MFNGWMSWVYQVIHYLMLNQIYFSWYELVWLMMFTPKSKAMEISRKELLKLWVYLTKLPFFRKFRKIFHSRVFKQSMPFHSSMEISENSDLNFWLNGKGLLANLRELMWSSPPIKNKTKINQHVFIYTSFPGRLPLVVNPFLPRALIG